MNQLMLKIDREAISMPVETIATFYFLLGRLFEKQNVFNFFNL
jgi:hypothetical protein